MPFKHNGPACCDCEPPVGPPITVKGQDPCHIIPISLLGAVSDGDVFDGTITTHITYNGTDVSTGSTFVTCLGAGTYVFTITSTNPHLLITPSSITVTATTDCGSLTYSFPTYFSMHYDYFDAPNTGAINLGDSYRTLCGCPCELAPVVHVEPLNPGFQDASFQQYQSGDCDPLHFSAVFAPVGYASGSFTAADITFQPLPAALPTFLILGFGGPFLLPSWGFFSDPFSITQTPDEACGNITDPCHRCGFAPGDCGVVTETPATVTGWYFLNCSSAGLNLYLIKKIDGSRLVCDSYGHHYEDETFWGVHLIWAWFGGGSAPHSTCDPLFLSGLDGTIAAPDGTLDPHPPDSPQMQLTA